MSVEETLEAMSPAEYRQKMQGSPVEDQAGEVVAEEVAPVTEEKAEETLEDEPVEEEREEKLITVDHVDQLVEEFEKSMESAPVISEEVGSLEKIKSVDTLKKMGYYAVFGPKAHEADSIGTAIKGVHLARFETKAQLKQVVAKLAEHDYKLMDILKARPISFEITIKKISEVTIGD
jgi:hypothetical protein